MTKKTCRLISLIIGFSMLASTVAYATDIPTVSPFPASTQEARAASGPGASKSGQADQNQDSNKTAADSTATTTAGTTAASTATTTVNVPQITSEGAVLMDADTGALLYSKNSETKYYPASITKLMTALLVAERTNLSDTVTFSKAATTNLEAGAVTLNMTEGDKLTVEQSLYGLMLKSANDVANGLAEHVSGSVGSFAQLMNAKARELGCTNTNFVNPNGLNNSNHYTTPHDMALIAKAAFQNGVVRKVCSTVRYQIPATKKAGARTVTMGHKMINSSDSRYYPGVIGGKTGFTSAAGNTLVTYAEKNGSRLIVVIMKSKSTHYNDTKALLDYGFALKGSGGSSIKANASSGWVQSGDQWFYYREDGTKACNYWVKTKEKWYYLGSDGAMLKDTVTPDGYRLDGAGVWIS
ncbi:MAG: peptidase S11 [Paenibacillaceae bacterium]|nr:peptidase S11 [Paenibacillaceae bacterium]